MKKDYRVIALDMDGTVLNDQKKITERTRLAIHRALAAGKEVVFCTGRAYSEMDEYLDEFSDMHYLCLESGALIYDHQKKKPLQMSTIDTRTLKALEQATGGRDILVQIFSEGRSLLNRRHTGQLNRFFMSAYQELYEHSVTAVEDVFAYIRSSYSNVEKVNLYHTSPEEREITRKVLASLQLPLIIVDSEITSLECTPPGINKAFGLQNLCRILNITMEQVIMVGDADNDCAALKAAGLSVAMGNAQPYIRDLCDIQTADNNHDGCAQIIETYLL